MPQQAEQTEANREGNKPAHGNAQFAEILRHFQGNDEKRERETEDYVAEHFEARERSSARAEAIFSALLSGYSRRRGKGITVFAIVPLAVSISLFLIADIESPRRGLIRVVPNNLITLSESLQAQ